MEVALDVIDALRIDVLLMQTLTCKVDYVDLLTDLVVAVDANRANMSYLSTVEVADENIIATYYMKMVVNLPDATDEDLNTSTMVENNCLTKARNTFKYHYQTIFGIVYL